MIKNNFIVEDSTKYKPVIGLEIHVELKTKTKMFCGCLNDANETTPNKNICPICLGHPGTLPTINKEAVDKVILLGRVLNSKILENSKFDRKNYFYPDLPKGYQISQYDEPFCLGGELCLYLSSEEQLAQRKIPIRRIHLEEDTGSLIHQNNLNNSSALIDFNRGGVPLMELVTEPKIYSAQEAKLFAQSLQLLLKYLKISEAEMEKGQMRVEVNISLCTSYDSKLGTKVEIKNLNSFKAVEKAIDYEIQRQTNALEEGNNIIQETRGWDDVKEITYSQRIKEEAQDYRYFPEPDLPPISLKQLELESLPELPWDKKERIKKEYGLLSEIIILLIHDNQLCDYFEKTLSELKTIDIFCKDPNCQKELTKLTINYLITDLKGMMTANNVSWDELKVLPNNFAMMLYLIYQDKISSKGAKIILKEMIETGEQAEDIMKSKELLQIEDSSLLQLTVKEIISLNPQAVKDYQEGKTNSLQFLIGQAMKQLKGAGNPQILQELFVKEMQ